MSSTSHPSEVRQLIGESAGQRKKRKTLACHNCRRQKLRCDQAHPVCGRCAKGNNARLCVYAKFMPEHHHQKPEDGTSGVSSDDAGKHIEQVPRLLTLPRVPRTASFSAFDDVDEFNASLAPVHSNRQTLPLQVHQRQISPHEMLESRQPSATWRGLGQMTSVSRAQDQDAKKATASSLPHTAVEPLIFRGSLYATHHCGATHPISLIARFPELQRFMVEALSRDTALAQVQRSLKSLQLQWRQPRPAVAELGKIQSRHLLDLLPERSTADYLINIYWTTYETTYRILYGPKFWANYQQLWSNPAATTADFVVIVLLAMASVSCVNARDRTSYTGKRSLPGETANAWIDICEAWIELQSRKNTALSYWQIRCLLLLAKLSNTLKKKRTWTVAGNLARLAMSAGFHRDPGLLRPPMDRFNVEIRRRLWSTILEMELQISIDRGMPSSAVNVSWDSANVLNVNDEDLNEAESYEPEQRPRDVYTSAWFLHISRESYELRASLNALLNSGEAHPTHEDVLKYDAQITRYLDEIDKCSLVEDSAASRAFLDLPKVHLDAQLRQFLILLHTPYAIRPEADPRNSLSRLACLNAASTVLENYSRLSNVERDALSLSRCDIFRSALAICHVIEVSRSLRNEILLQRLGDGLHDHIEIALERLADQVTLLGSGYTVYWYMSAAYGLVKSKLPPRDVQAEQKTAVDRVIKQYYKILASQEDTSSTRMSTIYQRIYGPSSRSDQMMSLMGDPTLANGLSSDLNMPQMSFALEPPDPQFEEFFYGDPAAWTFENLW